MERVIKKHSINHSTWPTDGPSPAHVPCRQWGWWCQNTHHGHGTQSPGTPPHHSQPVCRLLLCIQPSTATHPSRETLHLLPPGPPADPVDYRLPDQDIGEGVINQHPLRSVGHLYRLPSGLRPLTSALHPINWWLQGYPSKLSSGKVCRWHSSPVPALRPLISPQLNAAWVCGVVW